MKKYQLSQVLLLLSILFCAQINAQNSPPIEIQIGTQVWMSRNLDVAQFRNGDKIPQARTMEEWQNAATHKTPAWCYYNNDSSLDNNFKNGKLYNWYAVNDRRGLAPGGWHIPNYKEFETLINGLGGEAIAGFKLKNSTGWSTKNGNNTSLFSANPGRSRDVTGFFVEREFGYWWSRQTAFNPDAAWVLMLRDDSPSNMATYYSGGKGFGYSVRCIKD